MDVMSTWHNITQWCADNATDTAAAALPPAPAPELERVEEMLGYSWTQDMRDWYAAADGAARTPAGYYLPNYRPLPVSEVAAHSAAWRLGTNDILADIQSRPVDPLAAQFGPGQDDPYDLGRLLAMPAGTPAGLFLPAFIPIAEDQSGSDLFVDLRMGSLHGCVTGFVKGEADSAGPLWPSVAAMLGEVFTALSTGRAVGIWRPLVTGRRLDWVVDI